jgi:cytochrome P450 family 3 subfamily A
LFVFKNGEVSYDSVSEMSYMEMVIEETLRMYPPLLRTDRVCNSKDGYEYNSIKMPAGQIWSVPIWALHHDSDLYPDPYRFDPERFNEANKRARESTAFLPFGAGPRMCLGMRFALIVAKILLSVILKKYKFEKCEKTEVSVIEVYDY